MMALKLDPVRLLIADDVGIGKDHRSGRYRAELIDAGRSSGLPCFARHTWPSSGSAN